MLSLRCVLASIALLCALTNAVEFHFHNKLSREVWIGCQGNPGHAHLYNGGWKLGPGQRVKANAPNNWAGRFWARTYCDPSNNHCLTGDCGNKLQCQGAGGQPPVTLAEITLKGHEGLDFYDISLVDGYNVKMAISPFGARGDGSRYSCTRCGCDYEINNECPRELRKLASNGAILACNSACNAFGTDQYCCRGAHDQPHTCRSSQWPVNYPQFFKDRCPSAYSYAYDDRKSTFTCKAQQYLITVG